MVPVSKSASSDLLQRAWPAHGPQQGETQGPVSRCCCFCRPPPWAAEQEPGPGRSWCGHGPSNGLLGRGHLQPQWSHRGSTLSPGTKHAGEMQETREQEGASETNPGQPSQHTRTRCRGAKGPGAHWTTGPKFTGLSSREESSSEGPQSAGASRAQQSPETRKGPGLGLTPAGRGRPHRQTGKPQIHRAPGSLGALPQ